MELKGTFFIASLPRSRTAWLAQWMSTGESSCHHEALRYCNSAAALKKYFEATGTAYVGDSDSGLPFYIDEVKAEFPDAKLVVIERGVDPVVASLKKTFSWVQADFREIVLKTQLALDRMKQKHHPLVIGFEELSDIKVCQKLWEYCLPAVPFDEPRWRQLDQLTIEIHPQKYLSSFPPEAVKRFSQIFQQYK